MIHLVPDLPDDMDMGALLRRARIIIDELSPNMKRAMERHADGPQTFPQGRTETTILTLRIRGLLKLVGIYTAAFTAPTEIGRVVIVAILADEAERLIAAELLAQEIQYEREMERT